MRTLALAAVAVMTLCLAGCGNDRYAIERSYWKAQKQAEKIYANPDASPPNELERVVALFKAFIAKYPETRMAADAEFTISKLYLAKKEFDAARSFLGEMTKRYEKMPPVSAEAQFFVGRSYELEEKLEEAVAQYKKVIREYPLTPRGFMLPMYVAILYKNAFQPDKMMAALRDAVQHYADLSAEHPGTVLSYNADYLRADCYAYMKEWRQAADIFASIVSSYAGKARVDTALFGMATIFARELKDSAKAKEALERLVAEYPKSPLVRAATAMLKDIQTGSIE